MRWRRAEVLRTPNLKLAPLSAWLRRFRGHRTLGRVASFRGDLNTATSELKKAVELGIRSRLPCTMNLGQFWRKLRTSTMPQRRSFPRLFACNRILPRPITSRSHPLAEKQNAEALSLLQKAVQLAPQNAQAHYYLGRVLEDGVPRDKSDDETTAQAIEELRTAVRTPTQFRRSPHPTRSVAAAHRRRPCCR